MHRALCVMQNLLTCCVPRPDPHRGLRATESLASWELLNSLAWPRYAACLFIAAVSKATGPAVDGLRRTGYR